MRNDHLVDLIIRDYLTLSTTPMRKSSECYVCVRAVSAYVYYLFTAFSKDQEDLSLSSKSQGTYIYIPIEYL